MSISQLALWDTEAPPETLELPFSWADGDTSLPQLERLAGLIAQNLHNAKDDGGRGHFFQVLSTRIEDGRVIGTCKEVPHPWGPARGVVQDDEEDGC